MAIPDYQAIMLPLLLLTDRLTSMPSIFRGLTSLLKRIDLDYFSDE